MGLPDEGFGLSKKRLRLGLSSKRKGNPKEICLAEDQSSTVINSSNDMSSATHRAFITEEGKNVQCKGTSNSKTKDPLIAPVASLYNIGNTCYLNCMLQTLRYTPGFVKNLSELKERIKVEEFRFKGKEPKGKTTQKTTALKLVECLDDLFRHMRSKESDYKDLCPTDSDLMSIRPNALLNQMRKINPLFEENYQHDAQELLRCLLGCLDDAEAELEKGQAQRMAVKEEEKDNHVPDKKESSDFFAKGIKEGRSENGDVQTGAFSPNISKSRGRKRKSDLKEQECNNGSNMMMSFLNRKKTKSMLHSTTMPSEQESEKIDCNETNDIMNRDDAEKNEGVTEESKAYDRKLEVQQELNSSGDAQYKDCSKEALLKGSNDKERRKRLRLGIRGTNQQVESDVIVVSSGDEDDGMETNDNVENCAKSSGVVNRKPSMLDEITTVTENAIQKTCPVSEKVDDQCHSDSETSLLSIDQNGNRYSISPGKHLTIHSPLRKDGLSLTSRASHSRSFLSKIQGFLPDSARKFLNFSSSQLPDSVSSQYLDTTPTQSVSLSQYCRQDMLQGSADLEGDSATKLTSQCLYEAKLKLKRCDWLGVSPVRPVSANLVLERMKNESDTPSKRKIDFEFDETVEPRHSVNENADVNKMNNGKSKCDSAKSESTKKELIESANPFEQSTKYQGCKIKPLSIQLKKLDWLGTNCVGQSFNVQEILKKNSNETQKQSSSNCGDVPKKEIKQEKLTKRRTTGCQSAQGKAKRNEAGQKLVQGLFGGVMGHRTCCCECEKMSNRSETFLDVSIPVRILSSHDNSSDDEEENDKNANSCVFKLLKSLSTRERLCDDNKYFCDQCFALVEAEHFCFFQDLPKVLAIHLKRFDAGLGSLAGYVSKISDPVSVPEHLPCLKAACKNSNCEHRYSLYAVVTHSGSSILCGHYRSYVKVTSSFNKQIHDYMNEDENQNHPQSYMPSTQSFPQSSSPPHDDNLAASTNSATTTSLIGDTVEDIANNSFVYSKQPQSISDKKCGSNDGLSSLSSQCGEDVEMGGGGEEEEDGDAKSWWLECDDESIRVFEEEDFLDRLSEDNSAALLGTPYILFYHQNDTNGNDII